MTKKYNLTNIRALLNGGFTDEELRRICYDIPEFRPVYDELAQETGKAKIIDRLIEYADRKLQMDILLTLAKKLNPARYDEHQPYYMSNDIDSLQLIKGLSESDIRHVIDTQVGIANYLLPAKKEDTALPDKEFHNNVNVWAAILNESRRASMTITLDTFYLFEWFPRSPGLFHTPRAKTARKRAERSIDGVVDGVIIFNPYGKIEMLQGGVGCIRLRPKKVDSDIVWFMSASSTGVAHEGFPVALPQYWFERYIDQIANNGAVLCTLIGKLQLIPESLVTLFSDYSSVPKLYLLVEDILNPRSDRDLQERRLRVSAAVTFESSYEGYQSMYASYVSFIPGMQGTLSQGVDWLENSYVKGRYQGSIVTDFDEQMNRFPNAIFSLEKIMTNNLKEAEVRDYLQIINVYGANPTLLFNTLNEVHKIDHSVTYGHRVQAESVSGQLAVGNQIAQTHKISAMGEFGKLITQYGERYSTATIYVVFAAVSLLVAIVLFGILHSTGIMKVVLTGFVQEAEFGGAFAGFLITLIFLIRSYNQASRSITLAITGNVLFDTGSPVKGALVFVQGIDRQKKESDANGWFRIEVDERPSWTVRASFKGQNVHTVVNRSDIRSPIQLTLQDKKL